MIENKPRQGFYISTRSNNIFKPVHCKIDLGEDILHCFENDDTPENLQEYPLSDPELNRLIEAGMICKLTDEEERIYVTMRNLG